MTIILDPSTLPDAQTFSYTSDYVNVVDWDGLTTNSLIGIANVVNITFSISQPNVTINVANDRIWFNGYYTTGNTSNILYFDPPYGNDISNTPHVAYNFSDVPSQKYVYQVNQVDTSGVIVTHNFTVNYTAGGNATFSIDRYVMPNLYAAYNFLTNYTWIA